MISCYGPTLDRTLYPPERLAAVLSDWQRDAQATVTLIEAAAATQFVVHAGERAHAERALRDLLNLALEGCLAYHLEAELTP